jgi:hypothetical protein
VKPCRVAIERFRGSGLAGGRAPRFIAVAISYESPPRLTCFAWIVVAASVLAAGEPTTWIDFNKNGKKDVYEDANQRVERRIDDLLAPMNVAAFPKGIRPQPATWRAGGSGGACPDFGLVAGCGLTPLAVA